MTKRQFTTANGVKQWGYIHIPADRTKKYPVVFFCHGTGQVGKTEADASRLLANGPIRLVNNGWNPNYIIVAIQHLYWSFPPERIAYVLANDSDIKAYSNGQVMITGLSSGGTVVIDVLKKYHKPNYSYVPMSPAIDAVNTYPPGEYKVWGVVGNNDEVTQGALAGLQDLQSKLGGELTIYSGGHGGQDTYYGENYRKNGKNIYEWAFGERVVVEPVKKLTHTIKVYDDGSVEVSPD